MEWISSLARPKMTLSVNLRLAFCVSFCLLISPSLVGRMCRWLAARHHGAIHDGLLSTRPLVPDEQLLDGRQGAGDR